MTDQLIGAHNAHNELHSEQGARPGEHPGRSANPIIKVHDVVWWSVSVLIDYLLEFGACASYFGQDRLGGGRPDVGLGFGVVGVEV